MDLRRRGHQNHPAIFDRGQERILLRLREAMHLINKEDGFLAFGCERSTGRIDHTANVAHARGHRRQLDKAAARRARDQVGESRLTSPGWPPQDHRGHGNPVA